MEGNPDLNFEYVVGPDGPKRHFFPANLPLFQFHIEKNRFDLDAGPPQVPKLVFLGIRPCELAAIKVQDRVFGMGDPGVFRCESEPWYMQSRQESLMIAVNCTRPGGTCFCASWGTGPKATDGFDLALTELHDGFVVEVGSKRGAMLSRKIAHSRTIRRGTGIGRLETRTRPGTHGPGTRYQWFEGISRSEHRLFPNGTTSPSDAFPAAIARWCARLVFVAP